MRLIRPPIQALLQNVDKYDSHFPEGKTEATKPRATPLVSSCSSSETPLLTPLDSCGASEPVGSEEPRKDTEECHLWERGHLEVKEAACSAMGKVQRKCRGNRTEKELDPGHPGGERMLSTLRWVGCKAINGATTGPFSGDILVAMTADAVGIDRATHRAAPHPPPKVIQTQMSTVLRLRHGTGAPSAQRRTREEQVRAGRGVVGRSLGTREFEGSGTSRTSTERCAGRGWRHSPGARRHKP